MVSLDDFNRLQHSRAFHLANWASFSCNLEEALASASAPDDFEDITVVQFERANKQITLPLERLSIRSTYEELQAIRRRAEKRARPEHIREAKWTRAVVGRHLLKLSRSKWRCLCESLESSK